MLVLTDSVLLAKEKRREKERAREKVEREKGGGGGGGMGGGGGGGGPKRMIDPEKLIWKPPVFGVGSRTWNW